MKLEYPHPFSKEEAIQRLQALTEYWDKKHGIHGEWQGDTARIKGKYSMVSFDGSFTLTAEKLIAEVKVSFGGEILGRPYIERKIADYLNPQNTLDALRARV